MSQDLNSVQLMGRIVHHLELKQTPSGVSVLKFSIACQRDKENTDFFDCTAWRKSAEFINMYFTKGSPIIVNGELRQERFTTKDGKNSSRVTVEVKEAHFTGGKSESAKERQKTGSEPHYEEVNVNDDDLPF